MSLGMSEKQLMTTSGFRPTNSVAAWFRASTGCVTIGLPAHSGESGQVLCLVGDSEKVGTRDVRR